jgi:outer membrane immunogenic protein
MKKLLGGLALTVALATPVMAADLRMPVKAAPAPIMVVFDWTGCYVGGHAGWAWGRKRVFDAGVEIPGYAHDVDGVLVGGQIGCNLWQRDRWVFGIEGQAAWADIDGASVRDTAITSGAPDGFRTEADIIGSIAARFGYAFGATGQTLLFVKGGAAFIHEQFFTTAGNAALAERSDKDLRWGWMVGGGFEHALNRNWSFKGEYNYSNFGKETHDLCTPAGACTPYEIRQHLHLIKFGINYRFGGPLVARY